MPPAMGEDAPSALSPPAGVPGTAAEAARPHGQGEGASRRLGLHLALLAATFYTLTLTGALRSAAAASGMDDLGLGLALVDPGFLAAGLSYSLCLLAILGAHEMGHYVACRLYGVEATLPFFLPSIPIIGTFGAFIRIRSPIPNRRALFDIGVAGPIAGFVVALPVLVLGILRAEVVPDTAGGTAVGVPLLMTGLLSLLSQVPEGETINLSGPLMAGWVGCLATALNLFPVGQLDGGHICYAISPRFHRGASWALLAVFVALGLFVYPGWLFFATLLVLFGPRHPPPLEPGLPLSRGRLITAAAALLILVLCFIPRPFDL